MNRFFFVLLLSVFQLADGQLQPGFDKEEYRELMYISARTGALDSNYYANIPQPSKFNMVYRSPVMGLDNLWDLWTDQQTTAVVSIRGTTNKEESWLANFYAAMVPAKGEMKLNSKETFLYELAESPKAAVHVGWLLSLGYLEKDILIRIDSCYKSGVRNIILMGHSQGGAINFLLTAHLYNLQKRGLLPADIRFKTYCSAGPKPGNLYFAYEYEAMTQMGWAFNVVNSADWVPETPMSIQTVDDFNNTNPFLDAKTTIKKMKFPKDVVLKHMYNKLDRPAKRTRKNYEKYLGKLTYKLVQKQLPEYPIPKFYKSNNYVRTGVTIILRADAKYYSVYPDDKKKIFQHHFHHPYLLLTEQLK